MNWQKTLLICFLILAGGGALTALIFYTEPEATRSGATKETAMLVDVQEVEKGTFHPVIEAMGTVRPSKDIILSSQVGGKIIHISPDFTPGGFIQKGDTLLQIDPSDYKNSLHQQKSTLQQALSDLNIEMGLQKAAQKEYDLYEDTLTEEDKALVLRRPQLNAVKARVQSARAAVEQARLNLERTTIQAPFDAHILNRNVNIGSQVAPGNNLGELIGLDEYWIEATIPLSKLRWLDFPDNSRNKGSKVQIRNRTAWEQGVYRKGHLYKLIGTLENQTRMARVLITVKDPLALDSRDTGKPSLMIGAFVETSINADRLEEVIRLYRDYIRKDETVWVYENGKLGIRNVNIAFKDAMYAYITDGLNEQDRIITTNLTTVVEGAPVRLNESETMSDPDSTSIVSQ